jgi:hypothetical protein
MNSRTASDRLPSAKMHLDQAEWLLFTPKWPSRHPGTCSVSSLAEAAGYGRMSRMLLKFGDYPGASYAAVVSVTSPA